MRKIVLLLVGVIAICMQLLAQTRTVTGRVTDAQGLPVPNASVIVRGTNVGTVTSEDGNFTLNVPANGRTIVISAVGLTQQEINLSTLTNYNVVLQSSDSNLQEVVVIGYGTQRRREVTGNIATVRGDAVADKPVQSFDQALAGRAAGVQITVPNGVLNAPPVFRIRGTNSISLSSYPLIVVDGIPVPTGDFSSTNAAGNALASINPNDIETIDILKDAASTAIYGSRAANGVVFITTKKGRAGKPRVSYNGSAGWTNAYGIPEMLNAEQYVQMKNLALANNQNLNSSNPGSPGYINFRLMQDANGNTVDTRWADVIYRQGFTQAHNFNISGGNDNTTYYFSAGYTDQEGMIRKNDFRRANALVNVDSKIGRILTVGGKISYANSRNFSAISSGSLPGEAFATAGAGRLAVVNAPNIPVYNNDGSYNIIPAGIVGPGGNVGITQVGFYNPQVLLDLNRGNNEQNHMQSNVYVQLKPWNFLTLRTQYAIDNLLVDNDIYWNPIHGDGYAANGQSFAIAGKYKSWGWINTAQADYSLNNVHNFSALIGNEQNRRTSEAYGINRQGLSDQQYQLVQAGWTLNNASGMAFGENYLLSTFGRINYDYGKKYFVSANLRQDEYSAFADKAELFWGLSAGWEIGREEFWESAGLDRIFSNFRLRGSYGKVGNTAGIGDYAIFSTYGSGLYGGLPTLIFNQAGNTNLQWETSTKTDIGANFSLLNDRLNVDFAWYKNDISDLILNVPQAPSAGVPNAIPLNIGTMFNKGVELALSGTPIRTRDFSWNSNFNITFNKNEVTSLAPGLNEILTASSGLETVSRTAVGYPVGYLWVVRNAGVDPQTGRRVLLNQDGQKVYYQHVPASGQFNWMLENGTRYNNPNGTPRSITQAADAVMYASPHPKQFGGWDNTFNFKGFDLNILLTYQLGFHVYYGSNAGLHDQRFWNNHVDMLTAWQKPGDVTDIPRPVYLDNVSNGSALPMSYNVFKGDFVKLKNVGLGYNIPASVLNRAKIASARLALTGQNLHIFTKYPGPDPEVSSNGNSNQAPGVDRNTVANARTITISLNLGF
jgi:TonB-dependent starch-binding outer membrane protein SusC